MLKNLKEIVKLLHAVYICKQISQETFCSNYHHIYFYAKSIILQLNISIVNENK